MSQDINSIIKQLAEIDSASAKILQKTQDEKAQYAEMIKQQKRAFDEDLQKKNDYEVSQFQLALDAENENALKQCRIDCDNDIEQLNRIYNENSAKWVDDIFNEIIKEWFYAERQSGCWQWHDYKD